MSLGNAHQWLLRSHTQKEKQTDIIHVFLKKRPKSDQTIKPNL